LGLAQLERIESLVAKKREIFDWYRRELADVDGITLNYEPPHTKHTYWMVTVVVDRCLGVNAGHVMEILGKHAIDSRPFFHPLSSIPAYQNHPQAVLARKRNNTSYRLSPYGVNLPSALTLSRQQVRHVCDVLKKSLAHPLGRGRSAAGDVDRFGAAHLWASAEAEVFEQSPIAP
jgi:perosamine synthetase